jgi:HK97 family phage major capsid protein
MRTLEYKSGETVVDEIKAEVKQTYLDLDKKTSNLGDAVAELKKRIDSGADLEAITNNVKELEAGVKSAAERADKVDQLLAKFNRPGNGEGEVKSVEELVTQHARFEELKSRGFGKLHFEGAEAKAVTSAANSAGVTVARERQAGIIEREYRPLSIRDILPSSSISSNSTEFVKELLFTNNAAPVAEGAQKPESDLTFELATGVVRTLAHFAKASNQILDDSAGLASFIQNRLTLGLKIKEEDQILLGDGTGQNLTGIVPAATAYVNTGIPGGAGATSVDKIRWAKLQVRKSFYAASAVVLNPEDWAKIELLKDTQNSYLFSAFTGGAAPRLWGLNVVESDAIAAGQFLLGAFNVAAEIRDRDQVTIDVSTEDADNFQKNMTTIRVEERLMVNIYRPTSFVYGAL